MLFTLIMNFLLDKLYLCHRHACGCIVIVLLYIILIYFMFQGKNLQVRKSNHFFIFFSSFSFLWFIICMFCKLCVVVQYGFLFIYCSVLYLYSLFYIDNIHMYLNAFMNKYYYDYLLTLCLLIHILKTFYNIFCEILEESKVKNFKFQAYSRFPGIPGPQI